MCVITVVLKRLSPLPCGWLAGLPACQQIIGLLSASRLACQQIIGLTPLSERILLHYTA